MTKDEIGEILDNRKFSKEIHCYSKDKFRNLIKEIYFDGMREGYELAKFRLDLLDGMPFRSGDDYLNENLEKIKQLIRLCEQYENCD